ncbi:MAG: cytochrome c3 family protein [Deltaproteobacteria bacterium]|nr:cytochrome c3 family protein [Deltaproteobacteria bacterium]
MVIATVVGLHVAFAATSKIRSGPRSSVIYPPQSLPLKFSHELHVGKLQTSCEFCHQRAESSQSSVDNLLPTEAACRACHAIDRSKPLKQVGKGAPPARCDACHVGYQPGGTVARVVIPPPNLKFDHKKHVAQGMSCASCHGDMVTNKVGLATRAQLPRMQQCLDCHSRKRSLRQCTTCHLAEAGTRMKTDYPSGKLQPSGTLRGAAHDLQFRTNHRTVAQNDPDYCDSCHKKSFCTSCHNGVRKPLDFHVGDYIALHPIDARRDQTQCSSCHRLQTFCTGCHARSGVSADGRISQFARGGGGGGARYHPPGWVEYSAAGPVRGPRPASHHAFEAQRNIRSCASCHREEFCLDCHSRQTGSFSINPHPRGWAGSWRCRSLRKRAGRMCLRCHIDPAELTCSPFTGVPRR